MSRVSVEVENHIARVTLTRGDKMNALDTKMIDAIIEAGESLLDRSDVRAVVLAGEGDAFCAGLDIMSFATLAGGDPKKILMPRSHGDSNKFQQVCMVWQKIPVPVIAALKGVCIGGGLQIALGADIRIAAPDTRLSVLEMKWGLVPDMGGMVILPRLLRSDVLRKLTYTNEMIEAPQAEAWGLVTELADDPEAAALALAEQIAGKSPSGIRAAKALIDYAETHMDDVEAVLLEESRAQADLIGKPHQMEVIAANMQKRAPVFKD
ncbi:crotonase/enoyl-CoA hydratase family protein [Shimia sp. SDUM112013]|uniref:crotonase/enoyl-CoA hydratase family protein n=1 Tax=Shimia sp. SDUM112013 TaxID=3136160 RepID=UPI0032EEC4B3